MDPGSSLAHFTNPNVKQTKNKKQKKNDTRVFFIYFREKYTLKNFSHPAMELDLTYYPNSSPKFLVLSQKSPCLSEKKFLYSSMNADLLKNKKISHLLG